MDIVTVNCKSRSISLLIGYGNGYFHEQKSYPTLACAYSIAVGDFNGDTYLDIIVENWPLGVNIYLGYGNGDFQVPISISTSDNPTFVAVNDFNNDGRLDIATVHYDGFLNILLNTSEPNWSKCSVLSDGTETKDNVYAQCMFINVPIDWNEAIINWTTCTETMQIFVKRYFLLDHENSSHHLWRMPGGGGLPISVMENEAISIVATQHGLLSIYATDKRGVGQSGLLECPISIMSNFSACLPYIEQNRYRLKRNTFTNTARDLQYILDVIIGHDRYLLKPNQRVILMGSSQSTYLLQRYLHLTVNKQQVDAIILDSVVPTDIITLIEFDSYINYILLDLFSRCAQDKQGCSVHFQDSNPMRALYSYQMIEEFEGDSSCLSLLKTNNTEMGKKIASLLYPTLMQLIPALIYRINRCDANDKVVIQHFLEKTPLQYETSSLGQSNLIEFNNDFSELWSFGNGKYKSVSCDFIKGMSANTFSAMHIMGDIFCPAQTTGILGYPTDEYYRKYPPTKTRLPVLVLHGDMDQALPVPLARHFYKQYSLLNPNVIYVELPRTGHTATYSSPIPDQEETCGWQVAISFMLSPTLQPDISCLKKISPIDFAGTTTQNWNQRKPEIILINGSDSC
ncbi:unnamed protein product [Rotaria sordida]|uniref:Uncharacterized protein n=2 Tax=Rotaria sordida TaxID=392033 RepID=A0A814GV44_9BILA|nr:unnamed protein product [Rotaria sordida]